MVGEENKYTLLRAFQVEEDEGGPMVAPVDGEDEDEDLDDDEDNDDKEGNDEGEEVVN